MSRQSKRMQPASGTHLWLVLWKSFEAVRSYALSNIAALGLGLSDFAILELLLHKGPSPVNTIGAKVQLTSGSMTVAIGRLEKRGLVTRCPGTEDRRARMVHLTAEGTRLIEAAFAAHSEWMNKLGESLTPKERRQAIELLKKLGVAAISAA